MRTGESVTYVRSGRARQTLVVIGGIVQGEEGNNSNNNKGAHRANESTVQTVVSQLQNQIYLDIEIAQHARVVRRSPARGDKSNLDLDLDNDNGHGGDD